MRVATWFALGTLIVVSACGRPRLDTRTFELKALDGDEAAQILAPYVFTDRKDAPGAMSHAHGSLTVRETPDNLDKIARVLAQLDRPTPGVVLHYQLIQADGAAARDPAIADVENALRKLFRFKGYRLLAQAVISTSADRSAVQAIEVNGRLYTLSAGILGVQRTGDSTTVRLQTRLELSHTTLLWTTVTLRSNQSAVLGNTDLSEPSGTLILVVRPEITKN
jgi:hypothetical protein